MRLACTLVIFLACASGAGADEEANITLLESGVSASFRAIAAVDTNAVIVGGSNGTVVKTVDAGASWKQLSIADDDTELDFRDIEVTGDGGLILMSAGPGEKSRIFRSDDLGESWQLVHSNKFDKGFFNGAAFWKDGTGLVIGDPIDGRLFLLKTTDFGKTWDRVQGPELKEGEYGFAASGTGIVTADNKQAWLVTGAAAARVFKSNNAGLSWTAAETGIRNGEEGSGCFSIAVSKRFAVVVGGDYQKPELSDHNCAWNSLQNTNSPWLPGTVAMPHKACVRFIDDSTVLAVGRTGIMTAKLPGLDWKLVSKESFYTFTYDATTRTAFMAGADGRIARLVVESLR